MIDWRRAGWTGSLNRFVKLEIREHLRNNELVRQNRYSIYLRILHGVFDRGSFGSFLCYYGLVALILSILEFLIATIFPNWRIDLIISGPTLEPELMNIASYLIGAQVGVLGVASIAVGLVSFIAQHDGAPTDVKVYYHEGMAHGLVASSVALLAVLFIQLLWPLSFITQMIVDDLNQALFKTTFTAIHMFWLIVNLSALAHFVAVTLGFVQQAAREELRQQYTANIILPRDIRRRLRQYLFTAAGPSFSALDTDEAENADEVPKIFFGDVLLDGALEVGLNSTRSLAVYDVRMAWIEWVVKRWIKKTKASNKHLRRNGIARGTFLIFPVQLDRVSPREAGICRRQGGVPLTFLEKMVVRRAFKFRRATNE